jgi:hypothetical protein
MNYTLPIAIGVEGLEEVISLGKAEIKHFF